MHLHCLSSNHRGKGDFLNFADICYVIYYWKGLWPLNHFMNFCALPTNLPLWGALSYFVTLNMWHISGKACDPLFMLCTSCVPLPISITKRPSFFNFADIYHNEVHNHFMHLKCPGLCFVPLSFPEVLFLILSIPIMWHIVGFVTAYSCYASRLQYVQEKKNFKFWQLVLYTRQMCHHIPIKLTKNWSKSFVLKLKTEKWLNVTKLI